MADTVKVVPGLVKAVSPADVQAFLDRAVTIADFFVKWTKTTSDDNILAVLKNFYHEQWFLQLVAELINLLEVTPPAQRKKVFGAKLAAFGKATFNDETSEGDLG